MRAFVFVLALALIAVAVGEEKKVDDQKLAKLQEYQQECLNQTHADPKILEKIQKADFKADDEPKIKEAVLCFFKKIKFFDQSGRHRHQFILQKVSQVLGGAATNGDFVKNCLVQKDQPDETAVEMWQCIYKECENDMDKLNEIFAKAL